MEKNVLAPTKAARVPRAQKSLDAISSAPEPLLVTFPNGLVGCPNWQRFHLSPSPLETSGVMTSLDEPGIDLLVANPNWLQVNFSFELDEDDVEALRLASADDAQVACILTVHRDEANITANLAGPLVINVRERLGRQVILDHVAYPLRAPVITGKAARAVIAALDAPPAEADGAPHHSPAQPPGKGA